MNILHYFLGFPPYRTGGMTKYSFDLMNSQIDNGDTVSALWPGRMRYISKDVKIKKNESVNGIQSYEIINPLPIPLDEGIRDFDAYTKKGNKKIYEQFLKKVDPQVIHIHTLMGLHYEFVDAAKKLGIKTIFTSHDYFGLCPKVTFFRFGKLCEDDDNCRKCINCNMTALSLNKIIIMQSRIYRKIKDFDIVKKIRKKHRQNFFEQEKRQDIKLTKDEIEIISEKYKDLRLYYTKMLSSFDLIHFNSSVAEKVYKKYFQPKKSKVLTISHKDISDKRKINKWKYTGKLRLTCLAPAKAFKGFYTLKKALDSLWNLGKHDFELKIYGFVPERSPYMKVVEEGFTPKDLQNIFKETDILVAVSLWYETFGFTVLEALSYGVPVIVSNHVGAKDIIGKGGIIVKAGDIENLKITIDSLNEEKLNELREGVQTSIYIKTWKQFLAENYKLYTDVINICNIF